MQLGRLTPFERAAFFCIAVVLAFVALRFVFPASHWLEVRRMDVRDAATWEQVTVDFDRSINRDFPGGYRIEVDLMDGDRRELLCPIAFQPVDYNSERQLPDPITWEWFAGSDIREAECILPETGDFHIATTWVINPDSLLWERTIRREDRFRVGSP